MGDKQNERGLAVGARGQRILNIRIFQGGLALDSEDGLEMLKEETNQSRRAGGKVRQGMEQTQPQLPGSTGHMSLTLGKEAGSPKGCQHPIV